MAHHHRRHENQPPALAWHYDEHTGRWASSAVDINDDTAVLAALRDAGATINIELDTERTPT